MWPRFIKADQSFKFQICVKERIHSVTNEKIEVLCAVIAIHHCCYSFGINKVVLVKPVLKLALYQTLTQWYPALVLG